MNCISPRDPKLQRLAEAIAERVGAQRFHVWFDNSTRLDLKHDRLEIAVPNDFISEWIGSHFSRPIQEAANEVLGAPLPVRFTVVPQLFEQSAPASPYSAAARSSNGDGARPGERPAATQRATLDDVPGGNGRLEVPPHRGPQVHPRDAAARRVGLAQAREAAAQRCTGSDDPARLRHGLETFVVGASNQLAYNAACYVAEHPGGQYNPLFIHGSSGLGKTHLLQGLCRKFSREHPTSSWLYISGEEFTNQFLLSLRNGTTDSFRRRLRELDMLVIDDVHFLAGKRATQDEFLHTFNAIEAMGRQVVMASDAHPKLIEQFGESLINRFMSGMVVRVDPPNFQTRCDIMRTLADRAGCSISDEVIAWVARRVTSNVRELEGAINRLLAHSRLSDRRIDLNLAQDALSDLQRTSAQPLQPDAILQAVCQYFALEMRQLMSGRRQRTISIARSVAMFLIRRTARLSFPEIGTRLGRRNHSTVISACRRIERALQKKEMLAWTSSVGQRSEEADELIQRLEDLARTLTA